jgi:glycosyltransferase involved in cell wall biosynthesis
MTEPALPDTSDKPTAERLQAQRSARPRLSVIVPVYNGALCISRCLEALRESEFQDFEVIVMDDCSTDNTPQIIERFGARYFRTPRQMGPGGARNLGVRHAAGEILVFVDADVVAPPNTLGMIVEALDADASIAAVFGSYDDTPAWPDFLSQYKNLMHHYVHQVSSERAVTFWAGCGAIRKSIFDTAGGFNAEKYPNASIEDIELGYRLTAAGHNIRLLKQLHVKHLKKWTVRGLWRADVHYRAIPWTQLILETGHLPKDLNLTHASRFSAGFTGLIVLALLLLPLSFTGLFPWLRPALLGAAILVLAILLLALNWRVYAWFAKKRGVAFAAGAVLAHWCYYFYSGAVFALLSARHALGGRKPAAARG